MGAVVIGVTMLMGAMLAPAIAEASDTRLWIRNMLGAMYCLDSNAAGTVYVNPCQPGNRYQQWYRWNTGWTRNVATGRCLENPSHIDFHAVRTSPCAYNGQQYWQTWRHGWYQRYPHAGDARRGCLSVDGHRVWVSLCTDPFAPPIDTVAWFVQPAS